MGYLYTTRMQKFVAKILGVLNRFGSALNTNCRCRILQAFILPILSHYTSVWCWISNPVFNALNTTWQRAAHIALRQKTAILDRNTYETTAGILPFRMYTQYKCLCRVNSLLFMDISEQYLPSLITESDNQHVTCSASSHKFRLSEHNRSADKERFNYAADKLWNNLHWIITFTSRQPRPTSNY